MRKEQKLTQAQLAEMTGINRGMISRLESCDYTPSIDQLQSIIGLPCQVAAMKNSTAILPNASKEHLYTVDLICHGSPSPRILNMALEEKGVDIKKLSKIRFRNKTKFGL